jgi:hypothetical protein
MGQARAQPDDLFEGSASGTATAARVNAAAVVHGRRRTTAPRVGDAAVRGPEVQKLFPGVVEETRQREEAGGLLGLDSRYGESQQKEEGDDDARESEPGHERS